MTFDERLDKIKSLYIEGAKGSATAVQEANQLSERLRLDYPDNPHVKAYHGSIMILIARDKKNPLEKLRWSKNGLKLLDKAVAAAPNDSQVRYLRGRSAFKLPEKHFQRTKTAIEDYSFLIDQELHQEGRLGAMGIDYSKLTYELGEAYSRIGRNEDAAKVWTKLEQQTEDLELRQLLREQLQSLEGKPAVEQIQANTGFVSILIGIAALTTGNLLVNIAGKGLKKTGLFQAPNKKNNINKEARGKPRNNKKRH
ncbi:tetratricopeptide repeat protein [Cohnella yongneupensis]|uniref:Tetratricopeptide repeat protein n=1 Tax=Cohnella yongneupensis TaxID=425006 RepID=A0ABW0QXZ2_9BACL